MFVTELKTIHQTLKTTSFPLVYTGNSLEVASPNSFKRGISPLAVFSKREPSCVHIWQTEVNVQGELIFFVLSTACVFTKPVPLRPPLV